MSDYYVGLDLGQSNDYTALAVVQKVPTLETQTGKKGHELHLRHLERYPLKTSYTKIADHVRDSFGARRSTRTSVSVLAAASSVSSRFASPTPSLWWTRPA